FRSLTFSFSFACAGTSRFGGWLRTFHHVPRSFAHSGRHGYCGEFITPLVVIVIEVSRCPSAARHCPSSVLIVKKGAVPQSPAPQ
ncbi:MAG: hypothetical protein ACOYMN_21705, partial [Roseimicrobium sp.]